MERKEDNKQQQTENHDTQIKAWTDQSLIGSNWHTAEAEIMNAQFW